MPEIIFDDDLLANASSYAKKHLDGKPVLIVSDDNTYSVFARTLFDAMSADYPAEIIKLRGNFAPTLERVEEVKSALSREECLIAVGSGSLNDVVKYAAYAAGSSYVVCPTAPSMNGYTSTTASLISGKYKQSLVAKPPKAVWCHMPTISSAPYRMIRAGLGDVLCRSTVQADWLMSHLLLDTPYDASVFDNLIPLETEMLKHSELLAKHDPSLIRMLMEMLIISGNGMTKLGSSAPASQGEHMIAHTMELLFPAYAKNWFHGEHIAVTSLMMAKAQEKLLLKKPFFKPNDKPKKQFQTLFGNDLGAEIYKNYQHKVITQQQADAINDKLSAEWKDMKEQIREVMISATKLNISLRRAGAPTSPKELLWNKDCFESAVLNAHLTRDRFTFLDIAAMDKSMRLTVN